MKICPKCHTKYDDSMSFCVKDGCQLQENLSGETPMTSSKPNKRKGCLKAFIITLVVFILGIFLLYRHVMNAATYLRTEPEVLTAAKGGGTGKVDIDYDGYVWTINHQPDWVSIDEYENYFEIAVEPNKTGQNREGTITIQSGKLLTQVVVRQFAYATVLNVSESKLHFGKDGGSETVSLETDGCEWKAQFPQWIDVEETEQGDLRISCSENEGEYRTGSVVIQEDQIVTTIFLSQGGECNVCHGDGEISCSSCWGTGSSGFGFYSMSCFACGGTGKVACSSCNGLGYIE